MGVVSRRGGAAQAVPRDQRKLNERRAIAVGSRGRICVHSELCDFALWRTSIHRSLACDSSLASSLVSPNFPTLLLSTRRTIEKIDLEISRTARGLRQNFALGFFEING